MGTGAIRKLQPYFELHCKTNFSFLEGASHSRSYRSQRREPSIHRRLRTPSIRWTSCRRMASGSSRIRPALPIAEYRSYPWAKRDMYPFVARDRSKQPSLACGARPATPQRGNRHRSQPRSPMVCGWDRIRRFGGCTLADMARTISRIDGNAGPRIESSRGRLE